MSKRYEESVKVCKIFGENILKGLHEVSDSISEDIISQERYIARIEKEATYTYYDDSTERIRREKEHLMHLSVEGRCVEHIIAAIKSAIKDFSEAF